MKEDKIEFDITGERNIYPPENADQQPVILP